MFLHTSTFLCIQIMKESGKVRSGEVRLETNSAEAAKPESSDTRLKCIQPNYNNNGKLQQNRIHVLAESAVIIKMRKI